jgi:hypothetical protein
MTPKENMALRALQHFRHGFDTMEIAKRLGVTEARASMLVWAARCHARDLPADMLRAGEVRRIQRWAA